MVVWVTTDSQYVHEGVLDWMPKWKRNGWKNSKKQGVANAVLWCELDTAIGQHARVEFDWAKAHSGILLNECADQLATRGVTGGAYFPAAMVETPPDEIESTKEFEMSDEDVTRTADWDEQEHIAPGIIRVRSVGLAHEEEKDAQEDVFKRFAHDFMGASSDSPKASMSEGENELPPDLGEDGCRSGNFWKWVRNYPRSGGGRTRTGGLETRTNDGRTSHATSERERDESDDSRLDVTRGPVHVAH
jgi:hypothetical protein